MSKQDVIDYVMETPHNTNRTVLEGLVDTAVEESQVQADWEQNDPEAKDYIKNRPGGYYNRIPVLGLPEDITLSSSGSFGIVFIGEDDFDSFDEFNTTLILHFFEKEIPISWNASSKYYAINESLNGILIGLIQYNYYAGRKFWSVTFNVKKESILHPSDFYITKKGSVPFDNAIIPQANKNAFGALKPYCYNETDENYPQDDYQTCYQVLGSGEQNGRLTTKKQVRSYYELTPDIILNSCFYGSEDFIANFLGASDEIKNLLGVQDVDFPILMYYKDIVYINERPTYTLSVITQTGKHGTFKCKRPTGEMTPITWTFEGGGNSLFIITPTYNQDTKTWSTDRTWDEVKAAAAKTENPNDYAIAWDNSLLSPNALNVTKNSSGEITGINMHWATIYPTVIDESVAPEGTGGIVLSADYMNMQYSADSSSIEFTCAVSTGTLLPIIKAVTVSKSDDGTLTCDPTNTVAFCAGFLKMPNNNPQVICPLFYDGETYHYEFAEEDSSNIPSLYFSTTTNGIYKRLKITQGQNGATDTVVMDKEIELNTKSFLVDFVSGPSHWTSNKTAKEIYDAANQGLRVVNNVYGLILINWHYNEVKDKYNLVFSTSGYTADNLIVAKLSATSVDSSFKGVWEFQSFDCDGIFNVLNDSDIKTGSILSVQAWNDHKPISWKAVDVLTTTNTTAFTPTLDYHPTTKKYVDDSIKAIPVDGTTIKFNDQGQLTLALSNANGVSF